MAEVWIAVAEACECPSMILGVCSTAEAAQRLCEAEDRSWRRHSDDRIWLWVTKDTGDWMRPVHTDSYHVDRFEVLDD